MPDEPKPPDDRELTVLEESLRTTLRARPPAGQAGEARRARPADDLWADTRQRIQRRAQRRRAVMGIAALLVAVGATAGLVTLVRDGDDEPARTVDAGPGDGTTTTTDAPAATTTVPGGTADLNAGWTPLDPGPVTDRDAHTVTPTDQSVLVWGGRTGELGPAQGDGARYQLASATWSAIPAAPIAGRADHVAIWTGTELVVWGGQTDAATSGTTTYAADGAAYDPTSGSWRVLAPAPLPPDRYDGVWTGTELVVVGGGEATVAAAAYDPATDEWRALPAPPLALVSPRVFWSGSQVLVAGGEQTGDGPNVEQFRVQAYDPSTDEWTDLGGQQIGSDDVDAAMAGDVLVVVSMDPGEGTFLRDPVEGWERVEGPGVGCEDRMVDAPVPTAAGPLVSLCGAWTLFDRATRTWLPLDPPQDDHDWPAGLVRAGEVLISGAGTPELFAHDLEEALAAARSTGG